MPSFVHRTTAEVLWPRRRLNLYAGRVMAAIIIPASVFAAHANKLRSIRLEKLAQSIRRPSVVPSAQRRPVAAAAVTRKEPRRPSLFGR